MATHELVLELKVRKSSIVMAKIAALFLYFLGFGIDRASSVASKIALFRIETKIGSKKYG